MLTVLCISYHTLIRLSIHELLFFLHISSSSVKKLTTPRLPHNSTGRMKRGYGVESMLRLLSGNCAYRETHNGLLDALDELEIVRLLGLGIQEYIPL